MGTPRMTLHVASVVGCLSISNDPVGWFRARPIDDRSPVEVRLEVSVVDPGGKVKGLEGVPQFVLNPVGNCQACFSEHVQPTRLEIWLGCPRLSFVHPAPVTDARHLKQQFLVIDGVDHSVVAHANAPFAVAALHLLAARWPGLLARLSRRGRMRATN